MSASSGRRGRSAVSTRGIEMRSVEEEAEFRRELERVNLYFRVKTCFYEMPM